MDPALASFAAQARRLRQLSGPGFSFEKVEVPSFPLKNRVTAQDWRSTTSFLMPVAPKPAKADRSWPANSSFIGHAESERGKSDRRFCLWLDRLRRFHLRKANEFMEANASWHCLDGLSLLHQRRSSDDCNRHDRDSGFVLSTIDAPRVFFVI